MASVLQGQLRACLNAFPFIAITRGILPEQAVACGEVLGTAGFRIIENPLNSPDPYRTIELLARRYSGDGETMLIGAGTVLTVDQVRRVKACGGQLIISPNCNPEVIAAAKEEGLLALPGVATPSEAFAALAAGADGLKLFPAEVLPPAAVKALRAVLPAGTLLLPVGSIDEHNWHKYCAVGVAGFGLGSALYRPGISPEQLAGRAGAFAQSWEAVGKMR